jgi:osmotically-inducible protein OsmY
MWKSVKDFFGKGPKGYKRSDERIREDVCEALYRHPDVDASEIEVSVSGAEVTLKGTVEDRRAKRMAEDAAEGVSGVDNVRNEIRVQSGTFRKSTTELSPTDRAEKAKGKSSDRLI